MNQDQLSVLQTPVFLPSLPAPMPFQVLQQRLPEPCLGPKAALRGETGWGVLNSILPGTKASSWLRMIFFFIYALERQRA